MNSKKNPVNTYVAMWDMYGLESLINISDHERDAIIATLKGEKVQSRNHINYMILRARFNMQRCYEIYSFQSSMTKEELIEMFQSTPQIAAETVRELGNKIYSDRTERQPVIT